MNWEDAFFKQYNDACTGRLVRGLIHNLNGVNQAFSLQATLFQSMFGQAKNLIKVIESGVDVDNSIEQLKELLEKRSIMAEQMGEKVSVSHSIVKRIQPVNDMYQKEEFAGTSIASIIEMETEFLCADSFFKHKIEKHYDVSSDLPLVINAAKTIHSLIYILFCNAIEALQYTEKPKVFLKVYCEPPNILFEVSDNGCGVNVSRADDIFAPFVTTKKDHLGVGLYLLSEQLNSCGGHINFYNHPEKTLFQVSLPVVGL